MHNRMFEHLVVSIIWQMGKCAFSAQLGRLKAELALGVMGSAVLIYTRDPQGAA